MVSNRNRFPAEGWKQTRPAFWTAEACEEKFPFADWRSCRAGCSFPDGCCVVDSTCFRESTCGFLLP